MHRRMGRASASDLDGVSKFGGALDHDSVTQRKVARITQVNSGNWVLTC